MTGWTPIKLTPEDTNTVSMSGELAKQLELTSGQKVELKFGSHHCKGSLDVSKQRSDNTVGVGRTLIGHLGLPTSGSLSLYVWEDRLYFGPVVAVLADARSVNPPFGEQNDFISQLLTIAEAKGYYAFAVTPQSVLGMSSGYRFTKGHWRKVKVPAPDVCYDRCLALTHTQQTVLSRAKRSLAAKGVILFNRPVGSKERVYNHLKEIEELAPHLPETKVANGPTVLAMLKRHKMIYVKPSWGTQGNRVARIVRMPGTNRLTAKYSKGGSTHQIASTSASQLLRRLGLTSSRRILVQQGIDLVSVGSRLADIRVLVQRTSKGEWSITGCAARVGQAGSPVSNIHQGGGVYTIEKLLTTAFRSKEKANQISDKIKWLAIEVAKALDDDRGSLGELGIDIGVDKAGMVWFIEANPRPGRTVFKHIGSPSIRRQSVSRPMEFAAYLAAQKIARKEQRDVEGTHGPN